MFDSRTCRVLFFALIGRLKAHTLTHAQVEGGILHQCCPGLLVTTTQFSFQFWTKRCVCVLVNVVVAFEIAPIGTNQNVSCFSCLLWHWNRRDLLLWNVLRAQTARRCQAIIGIQLTIKRKMILCLFLLFFN